jgi:DnaB-like helicase C terminal domain
MAIICWSIALRLVLDLLVIDYIQLLSGSSRRAQEGRVQKVTEITTGLKALEKELNVPILALSQLSRQVESRDDKHPQLSDLRESSSIEQDADHLPRGVLPEEQGAAPRLRREPPGAGGQLRDRDAAVSSM